MKRPAAQKSLKSFPGHLVLLGAGKMGSAMLEGWLARGLNPKKIVVIEPETPKPLRALAKSGVKVNPARGAAEATAVVVAVKPQSAPVAVPSLKPHIGK